MCGSSSVDLPSIISTITALVKSISIQRPIHSCRGQLGSSFGKIRHISYSRASAPRIPMDMVLRSSKMRFTSGRFSKSSLIKKPLPRRAIFQGALVVAVASLLLKTFFPITVRCVRLGAAWSANPFYPSFGAYRPFLPARLTSEHRRCGILTSWWFRGWSTRALVN